MVFKAHRLWKGWGIAVNNNSNTQLQVLLIEGQLLQPGDQIFDALENY